ncbi:MAG: SpoIIE family protein phosphatase, partial [Bacteroidia bacterium]|nr:SpoIIE family protein phosphatase [Bacteroidia bacterium]
FKPKAVVSGDFYWAAIVETRNVETLHATSLHSDASSLQDAHKILVVAVVDCTGHGVPGAFISMLGISFLNEIVRKKEVTKASEVLDHLRESVTEALQQKGQTGEQKDGMDMSLVAINLTPIENLSALVVSPASCGIELCEAPDRVCERYTLQFAGANNPLYIIQSVAKQPIELKEISHDKMPIAIHIKMENFTNYEITLNTGDKLYLFSDGFPDQFGGPKGKKFKYSAFKKLIAETSNLSMKEQSEQIEMALENWMNYEGKSYEQIDDITVVGLKI